MWNQFWRGLANTEIDNSLSSKLRGERFALFKTFLSSVPLPVKILDVGGRQAHWVREGFCNPDSFDNLSITIVNVETAKVSRPNVKFVSGDARNMEQFVDNQFDVAFSNSVIEHVGSFDDQRRMANEIRRVSKRYFLQTPNRYFPIEPHFLFPFFQFFPTWLRVFLIMHFSLGWQPKTPNKTVARKRATRIRLLSKRELTDLFPEGTLFEEKFWGLTKSFIVYHGWDMPNQVGHVQTVELLENAEPFTL